MTISLITYFQLYNQIFSQTEFLVLIDKVKID